MDVVLILGGGGVAALAAAASVPSLVRHYAPPPGSPAPGHGLGPRLAPAATAGTAAAALLWRWRAVPGLAALAVLVPFAVALAWVDRAWLRLPDAVTAAATMAAAGVIGVAAAWRHDGAAPVRAACGGLAAFAVHALGALIGGMGFGDAKLAAFTGGVLAYRGWSALAAGCLGAVALAAATGVALAVLRHDRRIAFAYGPLILAAALAGLLA